MSSRYFDRLNPTSTNPENVKDWNTLKFGPDIRGFGKRLQSAELNEIQSVFNHFDEKFARTLLRDGEVVAGADLVKVDSTTIVILEGLVFMEGKIRKINDQQPKVITGVGFEYIKVRGQKNLIIDDAPLEDINGYSYDGTMVIDANLKDPALDTCPEFKSTDQWQTHNDYGAYREAYEYEWYVDSTEVGTISLTLFNGEQYIVPLPERYASFWQDVARRTFDESGNYVLETPIIRTEESVDSTNFDVVVDAFKVYLKGYYAEVGSSQRNTANKSRDTFGYASTIGIIDDSSSVYLYALPNGEDYLEFVKSMSIQVPGGFTKGVRVLTDATDVLTMGASVKLSHKDGVQFSSPTITDQNGVVYNEGVNYRFITGNVPNDYFYTGKSYGNQIGWAEIYWLPTRPQPAPGVNYTVEYQYWDHTVEGQYVTPDSYDNYENITRKTDFSIGSEDIELRDHIDFRTDSTTNPIIGIGSYNGSNFIIDSEVYAYRTDTVYVNQEASVKIIRGAPADTDLPGERMDSNVITLAYLHVPPYTYDIGAIDIEIPYNRRYTMFDVHKLGQRLDVLEYFMSQDILEQKSMLIDTTAAKKGIYTDGFSGSKRADIYFDDGTVSSTVSFDFQDKSIKLPFTINQNQPVVDELQTTAQLNDQVYTLPFEETPFAQQSWASRSNAVQPFGVIEWAGEMRVIPAHDTFVDTQTIPPYLNADYTRLFGEDRGDTEHLLNAFSQGHGSWQTLIGGWYNARTVGDVIDPGAPLGLISATENKVIDVSISPYIKETTITIFGENLRPNIKNLVITFDGKEMYANNPLPELDEDTVVGRVMTDDNGAFQCTITIPGETFRVGRRTVRVDNKDTGSASERTFATFDYYAMGVIQTKFDTHMSTTGSQIRSEESEATAVSGKKEYVVTNQPESDRTTTLDAIGQSFRTDNDNIIYVSSIETFFKTKDDSAPVTMYIVEMKNGYPTRNVIAFATLTPSSVNTSTDGSIGTKFWFPDPVALRPDQELAFTVYSGSPIYELFHSKLGERDLITNDIISKNPYSGVLFTSANQRTWQADGYSDLKFIINKCNFEESCQLVFNDISGIQAGNIVINTTQILPDDTDVQWFYSVNDGETWKHAIPAMDNFFTSVTTKISLRCDITGEGVSPMINKERTGLVLMLYDSEGWYVTRHLSLDAASTEIKILLEQNTPTATSVEVFRKIGDGNWVEMTTPTFKTIDFNEEIFEATYEETGLTPFTDVRFAVKLTTVNRAVSPSVKEFRAICS